VAEPLDVGWDDSTLVAGDCPLSRTLEIVGGKWNAMILRELLGGSRRFNELRASLSPIAAKTLAGRLRLLEDYDVISRHESPCGRGQVAVRYSLTARGVSLRPVLATLWAWGVRDESSW
jgi:DNA-binding HxlR family transcriptional regulator